MTPASGLVSDTTTMVPVAPGNRRIRVERLPDNARREVPGAGLGGSAERPSSVAPSVLGTEVAESSPPEAPPGIADR